jgi:hypothetical protein
MGNLASTVDIKKEVLRRAGERDDGSSEFEDRVLNYINYWYHSVLAGSTELNIECGDPWYWARAQFPGVFNIDPYYLGNSCTMTYGSINGTFSSIPLDPSGVPMSLEGWYIKLSGLAEYYRVVSHAAGALTFEIDAAFNDSSTTAPQSFTGYHLDYQLSPPDGIIRLAAPMRVYRRQSPYADDTGQVDIIDKMSLDRDYPLFRILQGVPDRAAITYVNDASIWVRFNRSPSFSTRVEYEYIPEADSLTDDVKSVPIIPHEHRIMLVYGAVYNLLIDKNDNRAPEYRDLTTRSLEAMVQANRRIKANMQKDMGRLIARRDMTHYTRRYYAQEVSQ